MRRLLTTTRGRLASTVAAVFLVVATVAATALWFTFQRVQYSTIDDGLGNQAQSMLASLQDAGGRVSLDATDPLPSTSTGLAMSALLLDAQGKALDSAGVAPAPAAVATLTTQAVGTGAPVTGTVGINGVPHRVVVHPLPARLGGGSLALIRPIGELKATLTQLAVLLAVALVLLTVVVWVLAHRVAGHALQPVRAIAATARDISEHDLHRRVAVERRAGSSDEMGELAATFNAMLGRLEAAFASLQQFTADAAHELRAPLAVLRAELEVSLARRRTPAEYEATERVALVEIERLAVLAEQLLTLARADAGALATDFQPVDVSDLVDETVERWRPLATRKGVRIETRVIDEGVISADAVLLRRVLDNLLDNAVRHTGVGDAVIVTLRRDGGRWRVQVSDSGPGVPADIRPTLFERFTRGDATRSRDTGGAGLGLALCRAIVELHGGSIALEDGGAPGATFSVLLPAA